MPIDENLNEVASRQPAAACGRCKREEASIGGRDALECIHGSFVVVPTNTC